MARLLGQRLVSMILVLLGVSVLVFLIIQLVPGDPARAILGPGATATSITLLRHQLGLDQPLYLQYLNWMGHVLHGSLGQSYSLNEPVAAILFPDLGNTMILTLGSLVICVLLGVTFGVIAGTMQYSWLDRVLMLCSLIGASVPVYWFGLVLIALFSLDLRWLPAAGMYNMRDPGGLGDLTVHIILPAIAAATVSLAVIARIARSTVIEVLQEDFVKTLRANGLPERLVIMRHVFRNILPPVVNIVGLQVGYLLGGVLFVEVVFNWPGLGQALYNAITAHDMPIIQAGVMFIALTFVVINLLSDLVVAFLDPRVRRA